MPEHSPLVVPSGQIASLAFLFYDISITFDDEVNTIWSKPNTSWIKWQFLFTRYFALAAQLTNRAIETAIAERLRLMTSSLKAWYMCQVVFGGVLMSGVEIVLMARVYALYQKSLWVGLPFLALILGEVSAVIVGIVKHIPGTNFSPSSLLLTGPGSYTYFGIIAVISQVTILVLTLVKYKEAIKGGWGRSPIMILMVRDGTVIFFVFLIVTILTVIYTSTQMDYYALIGSSWFLSIVACAGCRLIINMQNLPKRSQHRADELPTTVQLTTLHHVSVWD